MTTDPESAAWPPGWQATRDTDAAGNPPVSPCRIVVWADNDGAGWPAIVLTAHGATVDLTAFAPLPVHVTDVSYSPGGEPGSWRWPPRS